MALNAQFSLIHSEFNDFLFASVGGEENGIQLTVLSALARLGLDPWGEAARLSSLPKEAAARALGAAIASLPEGDWKVSDSRVIAARLVDRLPRRGGSAAWSSEARGKEETRKSGPVTWLFCIVLAAIVIFAVSHLLAGGASEPVSKAVSSTQ